MSIAEKYDIFIIDFDGTLILGDKMIPGAAETFRELTARKKEIFIISNKTISSVDDYLSILRKEGIEFPRENFIGAAESACNYLGNNYYGKKFYAIAEEHLIREIENAGCKYIKNGEYADFVIVSLDRYRTKEKMETAVKHLKNGAHLFAANIDNTYPINGEEISDAGDTIIRLTQNSGVKLELNFGKPSQFIVRKIMEKISGAGKILLIGDRLETDIQMAVNSGIDSALVKTGVKKTDMNMSIKATYVIDSVAEILK